MTRQRPTSAVPFRLAVALFVAGLATACASGNPGARPASVVAAEAVYPDTAWAHIDRPEAGPPVA